MERSAATENDFSHSRDNSASESSTPILFIVDQPSHVSAASSREIVALSLQSLSKTYIRLETFKATKINSLYKASFVIFLADILLTVVYIALARTVFKDEYERYKSSYTYQIVALVINILFCLLIFVVALVFTIRIARLPQFQRVTEQVNVAILCWSFFFYLVPALRLFFLFYNRLESNPNVTSLLAPYSVIGNLSTTIFIVLCFYYIWLQAVTYRTPIGHRATLESFLFYLWNLLPLVPYAVSRYIIGSAGFVFFDSLPLMSFINMLVRDFNTYKSSQWIFVTILFVYEAIMIIYTVCQVRLTRVELRKQDYLNTRMKQIASRFFVYHLTYCIIGLYLCELILLASPETDIQELSNRIGFYHLTTIDGALGSVLVGASYVIQEAWCHLPPQARGFEGWLFDTESPQDIEQAYDKSLSYRLKEKVPYENNRSRTFVLETAILMFNFTFVAYSFRGEHQKKNRSPQFFGEDRFHYVLNVFHKGTDTQCVIYESDDRIIVAFKGTTSIKDFKTDITFKYEAVAKTFPDMDVNFHGIDPKEWSKCFVHHGFGESFRSVRGKLYSSIKELRLVKKRLLFVTGHSLGGALAWLFTMGVKFETDILDAKEEIYTYTYGSPRLGNKAFRKLYESHFDSTWQVRVSGDLITKIPKFGYHSVGHKVLLTEEGMLFMDPSFGEMKISHWQNSKMENHKKEAYAKALDLWYRRSVNQATDTNIWLLKQNDVDEGMENQNEP